MVAQTVKCLPAMWETRVQSRGQEDTLEKEMAAHSSILAWRVPWTEEPGRSLSSWWCHVLWLAAASLQPPPPSFHRTLPACACLYRFSSSGEWARRWSRAQPTLGGPPHRLMASARTLLPKKVTVSGPRGLAHFLGGGWCNSSHVTQKGGKQRLEWGPGWQLPLHRVTSVAKVQPWFFLAAKLSLGVGSCG